MNRVFDGVFRLLLAAKGKSEQRLRPSEPTARSFSRISDNACRNSRSGATTGKALDLSRKASSERSSWPLSSLGQGILL